MRQILGAYIYAGFPPASPNFAIRFKCQMGHVWCMHPACNDWNDYVHLVVLGRCEVGYIALYFAHLCYPSDGQVPHAHHPLCTPAPPFWQLSTSMGYPHCCWHKCMSQLFWASVCAYSSCTNTCKHAEVL